MLCWSRKCCYVLAIWHWWLCLTYELCIGRDIQDYMPFEPFIYHGMADMHDRHRDMRLDVDNMSYEVWKGKLFSHQQFCQKLFPWYKWLVYQELLALEERIGDVSTGLSEDTILKLMKQQKYFNIGIESPPDLEPCCICQVWAMSISM